jgi:hypothetical protein
MITGVMIAPPAIALVKSGTNVPWRKANFIERQLFVITLREGKESR